MDVIAPHVAADPAAAAAQRFAAIVRLAAADMARVDALIRHELRSDVVLINQIGDHIVGAGGKRLRPLLVLLSARTNVEEPQTGAIALAAIIEFIHTATLLHDDVVDESGLRRGRQTANALWGNAASVLVGDFLYSRAFQMMVGLDRMTIMRVLADTTNAIAEGEVLQLLHMGDPDLTEARYFEVIRRKTAILFAAACRLGGLVAGLDDSRQDALHRYGMALGIAFQIADDVLDYVGDAAAIGKNLGDDLAEGKTTLPLIIAQRRAGTAQVEVLRSAIRKGDRSALPAVIAAIRDTDALEGAIAQAREHAAAARRELQSLSSSVWRNALADLADYSVQRFL
ncbi:MAG: geranylgeranyl pyrophosphate synthase [Lysobacterales bacterium]|nr:Octaprenyl diphosphate synthase [Xanthomonadales bacterium]